MKLLLWVGLMVVGCQGILLGRALDRAQDERRAALIEVKAALDRRAAAMDEWAKVQKQVMDQEAEILRRVDRLEAERGLFR